MVNATSASSSVKPSRLLRRRRGDRDPTGVPIDANFIFGLFVRKPDDGAGRRPVRIEANDCLPSRPHRVGAEQVDRDVARDRNLLALLADKEATLAVERNVPNTAA